MLETQRCEVLECEFFSEEAIPFPMATHIQANLQKKNAEYVSNFKDGHLALPPAKKYAVGKSHVVSRPNRNPQHAI